MSGAREGVFAHWPNRITMIRFVGALVLFAIFAIWGDVEAEAIEGNRTPFLVAFWLFTVIAATDFLDGYLARRDQVVTAFGRIADPFTDKVLILGTMVYLSVMPWSEPRLPATLVVVILAREFLVTGIRGYVESLGREFPADGFGKVKMIVQSVAVGGLIWLEAFPWGAWWFDLWAIVVDALVWLTLLTTVGSGVTYVLKTRTILAEVDE
ncbi:MAG: CDP-alcohol phosphatidyltransferase family protein [Planctomycetota bacterium]|nr:CDP-alcohol phosphatidyltransferase family protein [Planctomycetota bacterium]MEC8512700.1 CDP-alcohol phosphatidyltransferase family protein [Planctomycetota bacterium]